MATFSLSFMVIKFKEDYLDVYKGIDLNLYLRDRDWRARDLNYPRYIARGVSTFLLEYCNISLPIPTLNMVTIPDLDVEGLGQWGHSTFR